MVEGASQQDFGEARKGVVLVSIVDPILAMDVQSALSAAGFGVLEVPVEDASAAPESAVRQVPLLAALDPGESWDRVLPLFRMLDAMQVPCLLLTTSEVARNIPDEMQRAERLVKPFESELLLSWISERVSPR